LPHQIPEEGFAAEKSILSHKRLRTPGRTLSGNLIGDTKGLVKTAGMATAQKRSK